MRGPQCGSAARRARAGLCLGVMLAVWLVLGRSYAFDYIWWEAEAFATSDWPGGSAGTGWWKPPVASAGESSLSNSKWLNNNAQPHGLWYATYNVTVARGGEYDLFCRRFWNYGPFDWKFDGGTATHAGTTLPLLD